MGITKQRNISIDILKILSMVMVIILHTKTYGLKGVVFEPTDGLYWIVWTLQFFSIVAVNCFVLISGYFTSTSTPTPKKLFKLWLQVEIFSVGIYLILCAVPNTGVEFGFGQLFSYIMPVMSNQYWFFTCYFVLMIIAPFLNRFINIMEQREFKKCILVLLALFVLIPSFNIYGNNFGTSNGYSVFWFMILYLVAAYLRRYPLQKKPYGVFYIAISVISVFAYTVLNKLNNYLSLFGQARDILSRYSCITVFTASVCLFLFFLNHPIKTEKAWGKLVTKTAAVSFTVYLIHEHPVIRALLWDNTIKLFETTNSIPAYLSRLFIAVIGIFVAGAVLGKVLCSLINISEKLLYKVKK